MDNTAAFLKEYEILCRKYGVAIHGCGCCGTPYLMEIEDGEILRWEKVKSDIENIVFEKKDEIYDFRGIYFIENGEVKQEKEQQND